MKRTLVLLAAVLLAACQFKIDRTLGAGQIKATLVMSGPSGDVPAAGARISVENSVLHVTADSKGVFVLRGLVAGDYSLRITHERSGAIDAGLRVTVHLDGGGGNGLANSRDLGKVSLLGLGDISGTVVKGSEPVVGATVVLETLAQTTTDASGYKFQNLLSGDYFVSVVAITTSGSTTEKHVQIHVPVHVEPGKTAVVDPFDVDQIPAANDIGSVQGLAKLAGKGTNAGVQVSLDLPTPATLETDSAGDYLLSSAPAGIYTVTASQGGFLTVTVPYVVIGDDTTLVPPILLPAATPDCGLGIDGTTSSGGGLGDACTCEVGNASDPFDPCQLNQTKVCNTDADCGSGQFCDQQATPKFCSSCSQNQPAHCGAVAGGGPGCNVCSGTTPLCVSGACVGCTSDIDCTTGQYCDSATPGAVKTCLSCSDTDAQHCGTASTPVGCQVCSGNMPACVAGACSRCMNDQHCPTGQYCFIAPPNNLCTPCTMTDADHCGATCAKCEGQTPTCSGGVCQ